MIGMKIDKYKCLSNGKYRIYFSNGKILDIYGDVIIKNDLLLKSDIDKIFYDKIVNDNVLYDIYNMVIKYLSIRKRSVKEVILYLEKKNVTKDKVDIVINRLVSEKKLDDKDFAISFVNDKLKFTSMGDKKIIFELKKFGIDNNIISDISYLLSDDVIIQKIKLVIEKYLKTNKKYEGIVLKSKIYNKLIREGFSADLVNVVLNDYFN